MRKIDLKFLKNKNSATIAEVIVSVLIISITVVGVLNLFVQNISSGDAINYIYTATNLAKSRIERLRFVDFSLLGSAVEVDTYLDKYGNPDPDGEFRRSTSITSNYGGDSKLAYVDVTVYYSIRSHEYPTPARMTTIFSNY